MKILIICDQRHKYHLEKILFSNNIADELNVFHVANFEKAYEFLDNQLFNIQGHIDLIITADKISNNPFDIHLIDQIRYLDNEYSSNNFKINQVPVILYEKEIGKSDFNTYNFNARVERNESDNQIHLVNTIHSVVKNARSAIRDDLDLLGLELGNLQSGFPVQLNDYYLMKIKSDPWHWASRTKILSASFIKNPGLLDYDWMRNNRINWESDIEIYQRVLKYVLRYDRVHSEKSILHHLYNRATWLLKLDKYHKIFYEPPLMKNDTQYEEPDFVLSSSMPGIIPTNIIEIKPHIFPIMQRHKRKPTFKYDFTAALTQVSEYERHLRKTNGKLQLEKLVHYPIKNTTYTLLASNDRELEWNEKRVELLRKDHYPKITIETHDQRLRDAILYYERSQLLNVVNL